MDLVIKNLVRFVESTKLSDKSFETRVGWSNGYYSKVKNAAIAISIMKLTDVLSSFPELNVYWLFTGKGDMILDKSVKESIIFTPDLKKIEKKLNSVEEYVPPIGHKDFVSLKSEVEKLLLENQQQKAYIEQLLDRQKKAKEKINELFSLRNSM
ncbi:MAG: hypothetical protein ACFHWX_02075 [Bacteroidota bacterium]